MSWSTGIIAVWKTATDVIVGRTIVFPVPQAQNGEVTVITSWRGEGERSSNTRLDVRWPGKFPGAKRDRGVGSIYEVER